MTDRQAADREATDRQASGRQEIERPGGQDLATPRRGSLRAPLPPSSSRRHRPLLYRLLRLVRLLAMEVRVNGRVLMGAVAGYLMIGITAGLLLAVLETIHPGSFRATQAHNLSGLLDAQLIGQPSVKVWQLDFERLTYFAFATVTTVGYGDITPVTPQAQMLSVMFAIIGPLYIAVVMGVLISRLTVQTTESMELARDQGRPRAAADPARPEHTSS